MTVLRQIAHVMAKDARRAKWLLAVLAALIAFTAFRASRLSDTDAGLLAVAAATGLLLMIVIVVTLVHDDSPSRADAYWVSRPLHPTALLLAKLGSACLFLLIPILLVQSFVLWRMDLLSGSVASLPMSAAFMAMCLACAIVVAAATRDVKTTMIVAVLTLVGLPVAYLFLVLTPSGARLNALNSVYFCVAGLAMLLSVLWMYHTRTQQRLVRSVAIGSVYMMLLLSYSGSGQNETGAISADGPSPIVVSGMEEAALTNNVISSLQFSAIVNVPERLVVRHVEVEHVDVVRAIRSKHDEGMWKRVTTGDYNRVRAANWLNVGKPTESEIREAALSATIVGSTRLLNSGDTIVYSGRVERESPRILLEVALTDTASRAIDRNRVRVDRAPRPTPAFLATLRTTSVSGWRLADNEPASRFWNSFVLFNAQRGEAIILKRERMRHSFNTLLVAPGLSYETETVELGIDIQTFAAIEDWNEWLRDATFAVVTWDVTAAHNFRHVYVVP